MLHACTSMYFWTGLHLFKICFHSTTIMLIHARSLLISCSYHHGFYWVIWYARRHDNGLLSRLQGSASCCNGHQGDHREYIFREAITTKLWTHDYMSIISLYIQFGNYQFGNDRFLGDISARAFYITLLYPLNHNPPTPSLFFIVHCHSSNAWTDYYPRFYLCCMRCMCQVVLVYLFVFIWLC